MEREKIHQNIKTLPNLFAGIKSPEGFTNFYATLSAHHSPLEVAEAFSNIKWGESSIEVQKARNCTVAVIFDIFPELDTEISEEPNFITEMRLALKTVTKDHKGDGPLLKSLVLMSAARHYQVSKTYRNVSRLLERAEKMIDQSDSVIKPAAMELFTLVQA